MSTRFSEWPLVVFTTLAVMGAGLLTGPLVALLGGQRPAAASPLLLPGTALLAAGLLVSVAHLGQPHRAPLALARAGRSRLSNEIVCAVAALASSVVALVIPSLSSAALLAASLCAVAFLVSLGIVYALPGQRSWRGSVVLSPLVLGIAFASLGLAAAWDNAWSEIAPVAGLALVADLALLLARTHSLHVWSGAPASPLRQNRTDVLHRSLLAVRFVLVDVAPVCLLLAGLAKGAAGVLGLGILIDRLSFYLLAEQHTTEAEIGRIEKLIEDGGE